jgi:hypothetical protein
VIRRPNVGQGNRLARHTSRPHERRVLRLQPAAARPAPIEAAGALRHDPFEAQLAGVGDRDRALGLDRLTDQDAVDAGDEPRQPVAPLLERARTHVLAVEAEEVEGDKRCPLAACLRAQGVRTQERPSGRNATTSPSISAPSTGRLRHRLGDPWQVVKFVPWRLHRQTRSPCLRATIR